MAKAGRLKLPLHLPDLPPAVNGIEQRLDAILAELQYQRLQALGPGSAIASAQGADQPGVEVHLQEPKRGEQR